MLFVYLVVLAYDFHLLLPQIYLEMQLLAKLKYGLILDDAYFVGNSMVHDSGINETVQDLCAFTKNYTYNIIKQVTNWYCSLVTAFSLAVDAISTTVCCDEHS